MKTRPIAIIALFAAASMAGCIGAAEPADLAVASYPAAFVAQALAADDLVVADLATGAAVHGFEPGARHLDQLRKSTYLVLWDEGLESWAHRAEQSLGDAAPQVLQITSLPEGEAYISIGDEADGHDEHGDSHDEEHDEHEQHEEHDEHGEHAGHDHGHDHGDLAHDPHTWNDPLAMQASVQTLADALQDAYPQHADAIAARAQQLQERLADLHDDFEAGLATCQRGTIVTNHEAHNYLARRYGFQVHALHGLEPGSEPSPDTVNEAIQTIKELELPAIFIEEGADPDALKAIQDETDVQVRFLHTLESQPDDGDYLDAQQGNLDELRTALGCT